MAAPPDLKVLCRRLASTPVDHLPRLCPLLIGHVVRCGGPLSAAQDAKDKASETPMLVHKLRTHITTLLTGKNPAGRFAAICLAKAVIDVGGWESLRASDPWIKGLIAVLQKPDALASKELCIVTLTKIYMLLQGYQTLSREMATPTLPSYVTACLQLIKAPASGRPLKMPAAFIDTVACSLSKLVVLYPTTLRPFSAQIKAALRVYIAPTSSDPLTVPQTLRESSRRLFVLLSYTAAKNGSSEDWAKTIRASILDCHITADQVLRAVVESWESTAGYRGQPARTGADPAGGGDSAEELPPWTGVQAGSERLVGLLEFLADFFSNPTKAPVTVPLGELLDLTTRVTLVTPPSSPGDSIDTNPAIGRDEKAELWSVLPDIHIAALRLHAAMIRRVGENALPLATDIIDQMVRVFTASRQLPSMRETCYTLTKDILLLAGPTLPRLTVDSLTPLIQTSCQDILVTTGHVESKPQPPTNGTTNPKQPQKPVAANTANADAYLSTPSSSTTTTTTASSSPATLLLPTLLSHLPQQHLSPETRGLLDRTAILSRSKDAMLASCLHPYKDSRGRYYPSILPFLVRQFPRDQDVEVLRSNLIRGGAVGLRGVVQEWEGDDLRERAAGFLAEEAARTGTGTGAGGDDEAIVVEEARKEEVDVAKVAGGGGGGSGGAWGVQMDVDVDVRSAENANPFAVVTSQPADESAEEEPLLPPPASPLKRKSDQLEVGNPSKRVDTGKAPAPQQQTVTMENTKPSEEAGKDEGGSDSDSEGSVQIDMTLDDDDDDEEEADG
ncbi:Pre-rRNA-processing protein rix1 [Madurella mycetomatis]|uniref:Pre-rRNA-processing protein RIX1 n=1 Tax=Madurella mycetomatis TaxID=100816 RepID=A0A175W0B9_9PEZI|nr:Pre-rRNA-processing protein rix1 [Madurella mycetomatis]